MRMSVVLALIVVLLTPITFAETLVWQHEAWSQKEIDSITWRYYPNGSKKGTTLKGVVCRQTEVQVERNAAGVFNCSTAPPKVVGWIRLTAQMPHFGESQQSDPIYIPPVRPKPPARVTP